MHLLRDPDPGIKLCAALALIIGVSTCITLALLGELSAISSELASELASITAASGKKLSTGTTLIAGGKLVMARRWVMLGIGANTALAIMVVLWLRAELARPLHRALVALGRIGAGDLLGVTQAATPLQVRGDAATLLSSIQDMNDKLAGRIGRLRAGSAELSHGSGNAAGATRRLAARGEQQAQGFNEGRIAVKQLDHHLSRQQQRVRDSIACALSTSASLDMGGEALGGLTDTIRVLTRSGERVALIVDAIDDIAFQTHVLALSTAVEAVRSGEGSVIAQVATEVRYLAQRSTAAARDLKALVDTCTASTATGAALAEQARGELDAVTDKVRRVSAMLTDTQDAGQVQEAGMIQLSRALATLGQEAQEQTALADDAASAAAHLRDQAGALSRLLDSFMLGPEHAQPASRIQLVASNPGKPSSPARAVRSSNGVTPVRREGQLGGGAAQ